MNGYYRFERNNAMQCFFDFLNVGKAKKRRARCLTPTLRFFAANVLRFGLPFIRECQSKHGEACGEDGEHSQKSLSLVHRAEQIRRDICR